MTSLNLSFERNSPRLTAIDLAQLIPEGSRRTLQLRKTSVILCHELLEDLTDPNNQPGSVNRPAWMTSQV
jgi:hypothetical protein